MKTRTQPEDKPETPDTTSPPANTPAKVQRPGPITDAEGLDRAYADQTNMYLDSQGTLFVSGTKSGFLGQEWIENYKTMGVPLIEKMLGVSSEYRIEENERYKQLDECISSSRGNQKHGWS